MKASIPGYTENMSETQSRGTAPPPDAGPRSPTSFSARTWGKVLVRTAKQFNVPFLGSIELVPAIREGGDRGLPVALAGPKSPQAAEFFSVAQKLMEQAEAAAAKSGDVVEIR